MWLGSPLVGLFGEVWWPQSRKHVLGWGTCLGVGLMMDRLTVGFFLVPAVLPLLRGTDRKV